MLVYNGAGMETWIEKIVNSIDTDRIRIVEASKVIKLSKHTEDEHGSMNSKNMGSMSMKNTIMPANMTPMCG